MECLTNAGALLCRTEARGNDLGCEGIVLFRQRDAFETFHIPLDGLLVVFQPKSSPFSGVAVSALPDMPPAFEPIDMDYLHRNCNFSYYIGPGELGGLLGLFLKRLLSKKARDFVRSNQAVKLANLETISRLHFVSAFVTPNTHYVAIPAEEFQAVLRPYMGVKGADTPVLPFQVRCRDEFLLRQALRYNHDYLRAIGMHDRLVARHLHDYLRRKYPKRPGRTPDSERRVSTSYETIAWYLNFASPEEAKRVMKHLTSRCDWIEKSRGCSFLVDARRALRYYSEGLRLSTKGMPDGRGERGKES
ncbi:MAG: hypothetical protein JSS66_17045 [Armatimonadetes bacterium]|nr:hypothetical protein [Armatimonadota bacterium]